MIAVFAEREKNTIVARMTDGRDARGRIDGEKGGRMPLGYTRTDDGVIVVPDEAAIVRQIFELRQQGLILQAIADNLNAQGLKSKQGGKWWPSTVKQVLSAEDKYKGGLRGYSPIYWPAILEG
jgi:DNA invertase Pin-like site-specific DNA recombinase